MITRDSREQLPFFQEHCDAKRLLAYEGDNGEQFSYDFEVSLRDGSVLKVERKAWGDCVASFLADKLDRQVWAVDMLIVEQDLFDFDSTSQAHLNTVEHLKLLNLLVPVQRTEGPAGTLALMRRFEAREGGLKLRANRIARTSIDDARLGIVRAVMAGSGHSPDREVPGGHVGDLLATRIDWQAVAEALAIRDWGEKVSDWGGRRPSMAALSKMRGRLVEPTGPEGRLPPSPPASHPSLPRSPSDANP